MEVVTRYWGPTRRGQTQLWGCREEVPKVLVFWTNSQLDLFPSTLQCPPYLLTILFQSESEPCHGKQLGHIPLFSYAWRFRSKFSKRCTCTPGVPNEVLGRRIQTSPDIHFYLCLKVEKAGLPSHRIRTKT